DGFALRCRSIWPTGGFASSVSRTGYPIIRCYAVRGMSAFARATPCAGCSRGWWRHASRLGLLVAKRSRLMRVDQGRCGQEEAALRRPTDCLAEEGGSIACGWLERHGIPVCLDLPGVGQNLQDRYEVGIVSCLKQEWEALKGAYFSINDRQGREWATARTGVYTTNGAALAVIKRSLPKPPLPDLFMFALLGRFHGYFPTYSKVLATAPYQYLTWAVLKAHTHNRAGTVALRSSDPRDTPVINFNDFEEGGVEDVESVAAGIEFVLELTSQVGDLIEVEERPGPEVQGRAALEQFVKDRCWGHHASCTCPIGRDDDPKAVLDTNFRVRGTTGRRVVDASVFPKIPGFFIVTSVYMIGEKAAEVISADAAKSPRDAAPISQAPAARRGASRSRP